MDQEDPSFAKEVPNDADDDMIRRSGRTKRIKFDLGETQNLYPQGDQDNDLSSDSEIKMKRELKRAGSSVKPLSEANEASIPEGRYGLRERSKRLKPNYDYEYKPQRQTQLQYQEKLKFNLQAD